MRKTSFAIQPVRSAINLEAAGRLFDAYAASLGVDLGYQDYETERSTLPGKYAPPDGELLLACDDRDKAVGCVGVRPIRPEGCCEMKRLHVIPAARGLGLGRMLVDAVLAEAMRIGYREMRLDTLPTMIEAIALNRVVLTLNPFPSGEKPSQSFTCGLYGPRPYR